MRKSLVFSFAVLMLLAFAGCGSEKPEKADQDIKSAAMEAMEMEPIESDLSKSAAGETLSEPVQTAPSAGIKEGSLSVATDKSLELPENYPSDKFPVYEGSFIYSAIETNGSYVLTAYSKDEVERVIGFYEKLLEGAKADMETKTDDSLTSMGTKNGYAYTLDIGKSTEKGYQTIITISLQPTE